MKRHPMRPESFELARQMASVLIEENNADYVSSYVATLKRLVDILLATPEPVASAQRVARYLPGLVRTELERKRPRVLTPTRKLVSVH